MPAAISIGSRLRAQFSILSVAGPNRPVTPIGVLLLDPATDRLEWKLRADVDELGLTPEDVEYVGYLDSDFRTRVKEMGAADFLASLEDSLSGFLRISDRELAVGRSFEEILDRLFSEHVDTRVRQYETHLPYYALRAAATKFGEDLEVSESEIEWVRAPRGLRLSRDLFVVEVVGRSMEPLIPDGSLVIFRKIAPGSRKGKRLLIEEMGASDSSARYSVKRYTSFYKKEAGDDEWAHSRIRLEPLNPEFPAFDLDAEEFESKYKVIGEFVQVLSSPE
jgi:phage repressor protein C with HTH and peptisase S24 domain